MAYILQPDVIVKQPNGLYALYRPAVQNFIATNMALEEAEDTLWNALLMEIEVTHGPEEIADLQKTLVTKTGL